MKFVIFVFPRFIIIIVFSISRFLFGLPVGWSRTEFLSKQGSAGHSLPCETFTKRIRDPCVVVYTHSSVTTVPVFSCSMITRLYYHLTRRFDHSCVLCYMAEVMGGRPFIFRKSFRATCCGVCVCVYAFVPKQFTRSARRNRRRRATK